MEAALAVPASKGADISTAADAATANTMVLMFVPLLPLPSQRETLQLVPGAKWCIAGGAAHDPRVSRPKGVMRLTAKRRLACNRLGAVGDRRRRPTIGGRQRLERSRRSLFALEQEGPHARGEIRMERAMY